MVPFGIQLGASSLPAGGPAAERPYVRQRGLMLIRSLSVLLAIVFVGCVPYHWFDKVGYYNMAPRLEYQGFSFKRPPNRHWYMLQSEQSHTEATLRREVFSFSETHTFYATVALGGIERQPESHEEFAELARSKGQQAPYETTTVSYEQTLTTRQNQWCIRVDGEYSVVGAPQAPERELTMIVRGYRCLHPAWPKTTLDFFFSERGLPDQLNANLLQEGEAFIESIRIDVASNTPAT
jgi:hypothetical protein